MASCGVRAGRHKGLPGREGLGVIQYDHELTGWDFEPRNAAPGLVLETHAMWGFAVSKKVAQWYSEQFVEGSQGGEGRLSYDTDNGTQTVAQSSLQDSGVRPADAERPSW